MKLASNYGDPPTSACPVLRLKAEPPMPSFIGFFFLLDVTNIEDQCVYSPSRMLVVLKSLRILSASSSSRGHNGILTVYPLPWAAQFLPV